MREGVANPARVLLFIARHRPDETESGHCRAPWTFAGSVSLRHAVAKETQLADRMLRSRRRWQYSCERDGRFQAARRKPSSRRCARRTVSAGAGVGRGDYGRTRDWSRKKTLVAARRAEGVARTASQS